MNNKIFLTTALALTFLFAFCLEAFAASQDEYYFLTVKGECDCIESIKINNLDILGGRVKSVKYPIKIQSYLKNGLNSLKLTTTSKRTDPLELVIDKRHLGPKIEKLVTLSSQNLRAENNFFVASVKFNLSILNSTKKEKDSDRKNIELLLNEYFQALNQKDLGTVNSMYAKSLKIEEKLRPSLSKYLKSVLKEEGKLLKMPELEITCQPLSNVVIIIDGSQAIAKSKDNSNLIESTACEVKRSSILLGLENKLADEKVVSLKLTKAALKFAKSKGKWSLSIPIGVQ